MSEPALKVFVLRHTDGTPPGLVTEWLKGRPYHHEVRSLHRGDALPALSEVDWFIVLGGEIGVHQEQEFPWLRAEKDLLKQAIEAGIPCLGLCLGAQLLAEALGSAVRQQPHFEGGWWPVRFRNGKAQHFFHFHEDSFDIPEGAVHLASSDACRSQAFLYREHVLALQFHPEATLDWIQECMKKPQYKSGKFTQAPVEVIEQAPQFLNATRTWFFEMLQQMEKSAFSRRLHVANEAQHQAQVDSRAKANLTATGSSLTAASPVIPAAGIALDDPPSES